LILKTETAKIEPRFFEILNKYHINYTNPSDIFNANVTLAPGNNQTAYNSEMQVLYEDHTIIRDIANQMHLDLIQLKGKQLAWESLHPYEKIFTNPKIITSIMLIPFVVSSMNELLRNSKDDFASQTNVRITGYGFAIILLILLQLGIILQI